MRNLRAILVASTILAVGATGFVGCCDEQVVVDSSPGQPTASAPTGAATPLALGQLVVESLKRGTLSEMVSGALRMEDGDEVRARFRRGGFELSTERWDGLGHDREHKLMATWRDVWTYGELAGFDWSEVQVEKVTAGRRQAWMGVTTTDLSIIIVAQGAEYEIQADDCLRLARGWVVGDGLRWVVDGSKGLPTRRPQADHPPHDHRLESKASPREVQPL